MILWHPFKFLLHSWLQDYTNFFSHSVQGKGSSLVSLFMRKDYTFPKFMSYSLQGWGFSPVWVSSWNNIIWTSCHILCKDKVPYQYVCSWKKITQTSCHILCKSKVPNQVEFFIWKDYLSPKLLVTCFAWMRFLTSLSLLMRKVIQTFCHILCSDEDPYQ